MKKTLISLLLLVSTVGSMVKANSNVGFAYDAGAELVSSYIWRGQYCSGLSLQPNLAVGYDGRISSMRVGVWGSVGATDWKFSDFYPEVDLFVNWNILGIQIGATHQYYFGGSPFFCWSSDELLLQNEDASSQTEITLGYTLETLLGIPLYFSWNTMVAGYDFNPENDKRAYSTYIEIGYTQELPHDMYIGAVVGFSPWKSLYTDWDKDFAFNNISLCLGKEWNFENCSLDLYAMGAVNTCNISKENLFVSDPELKTTQKLNGTIGLGVWF